MKPILKAYRRRASRLACVQALYQYEQDPKDIHDLIFDFLHHHLEQLFHQGYVLVDMDENLFKILVTHTLENLETIDSHIVSVLSSDWKFDRLDAVLKAILRVGTAELRFETPTPVVLNEYIEISKAFADTPEVSFVNGALDKLAKLLK